MALTLAEANTIVQGALAKAKELNIRISVAVCDAGGRLVAFNRMDGAIWGSVYGCQGKAIASVAFGRASGELAERAARVIGLDHAGVDLMRARDGTATVLEVNGVPAWQGLQSVAQVDLAARLAHDFLHRRLAATGEARAS